MGPKPTYEMLQKRVAELEAALARRQDSESSLKARSGLEREGSMQRPEAAREELERLVKTRTKALVESNQALKQEVAIRKRVEADLRASEDKFSKLFYASPLWMEVTTLSEGRYIEVNEAFVALTGYSRTDVLGRPSTEFGLWLDPDRREDVKATLYREGSLHQYPCRFKMRNGVIRDLLLSAEVIQHNRELCAISVLTDITAIRDAERALQESKQWYQNLFERANDAIFIESESDAIIDVNHKACELLGYSRDELIDMTVADLQAPETRGRPGHVIKSELSLHQGRTFEAIDLHKDGTRIPVEVSTNRLGIDDLVLSIVRDIRERKQAQQALDEAYGIIEKSPAAAFIWDNREGWPVRFVTRNVVSIFGYTAEELQSGDLSYADIIHPDDLERVSAEVTRYSVTEGRTEFVHQPYRIITKGGDIRWVDDKTTVRRDPDGNITGYQGIVEDATARKEAEEALRESEEKFAKAFHTSPDAIAITGVEDGTITEVNDGFVRISGYQREEVIGRTTDELDLWAQPGDREKYFKAIEAHGSVRDLEFPFRIKTGEVRLGLVSGDLIQFGRQRCVLGIVRDITARKLFETALKESEERFRQIAENISGVFWLFDWRAQSALYVSPAYDEIWGRSHQALYDRHEEWTESIHPDDLDYARDTFNRILETGGGETREYRIIRPDGSIRWISDTGYAIKDEKGEVIRIAGIAEDITARKKAEEALSAEKERLAVTLNSITDGVITTDRQGRITLMNPVAERLTGWRQSEAIGLPLQRVFNIIDEVTGESCPDPVTEVISTGEIVALGSDTVLICRDGSEHVIGDTAAPIKDSKREIIGVVLVFRDVTDTRKMERELLKVEKLEALGVLAGGIAHDFNNFLAGIIGNLSLVKLDARPRDGISPILDEMERAALRAKNLTQQLLTFSKGGEPVKQTADLAELIRDAALFALRGSNVICEFSFDPDLFMAEVDEGQVAQVIHNLILNADQAMPGGGSITIRGGNAALAPKNALGLPPGDYVKIEVLDRGTGIKKEYLKKIFDPYFSTKQKGSGLGLAVAFSVIEKHNGRISVASEIGEGTTFTIHLPAAFPTETHQKNTEAELASGADRRVLVMDDEEFIRKLADQMLKKMNYNVELARNGEEAIAQYKRAMDEGEPFDAVVLDLTVPGRMGGKEALKGILKLDPDARAIVSSGYSNDPVMANYGRFGFRQAIRKPYLIQEMSAALKEVLEK